MSSKIFPLSFKIAFDLQNFPSGSLEKALGGEGGGCTKNPRWDEIFILRAGIQDFKNDSKEE